MKILTIILGIMITMGGVSCLFTPGATFLSLAWLVGVMLIVAGINGIAAFISGRKSGSATVWDLLSGILSVFAGATIITNSFTYLLTSVMLVFAFATWITLTAVFRIVSAFRLKKLGGSWALMLVFGVISLLLGVYSFLHPLFTALTLGYLIGFWVIMQGANLLAFGLSFGTAKKAE